MKKFINSVEPVAMAASGVDAAAIAQANLSTEKDITQLLGAGNETEDSVGRDGSNDQGGECGDGGSCGECNRS